MRRRHNPAERRAKTVEDVMAHLYGTEGPETTKQGATEVPSVHYPKETVSTSQEIEYNTQAIAGLYEQLLPDRELGGAFSTTLNEVVAVLEKESVEPQGELYFNALSELRLLTEVERLFIEKDFEHVDVLDAIEKSGQSSIVKAFLNGIRVKMKAIDGYPQGMEKGTEHEVEATFATWRYDPAGIRLEVEYTDPVTGKPRKAQAQMDFHYRQNPKFEGQKQAALDLKGEYLLPAIRGSLDLDHEYHRYQHLDPLIRSDEEFEVILSARLKHAQHTVNLANSTRSSIAQA